MFIDEDLGLLTIYMDIRMTLIILLYVVFIALVNRYSESELKQNTLTTWVKEIWPHDPSSKLLYV